ncbi:metal-sensitive transcriptional regulator [Beijerinckia mobilis]|uniref:metal-sensitive transcriptional regulator n=1 Tax=Beijerinckia mobilis TaxID=231434 RepID=UPI000552BFB6|nr:metal-sensitive transcriptional regulator [Beijerinckia mobilis]
MRASRTKISSRLRRVEGQIRGIQKMVDEDRYCVDILIQLRAVKAALHKVEALILRDHVSGCVVEALASGDAMERQDKIDELIETINRMTE